MDWLSPDTIGALGKFAKQQPGMALVMVAVICIFAPKIYRHFRKKTRDGKDDNYDLRDIWRYPSEWAPILILLTGLYIVATSLK